MRFSWMDTPLLVLGSVVIVAFWGNAASYSSPVVVFLLSLSLLLLYLMLSPVLLELFYISLSLFLLSSSVLCGWLLITTLYFWFPCRTLEAAQCSQFTDAGFQALCRVSTLPLKACLQLNMALCVPLFFSLYTVFHGHMRKIIKVFTQCSKKSFDVQFSTKIGCRALEIFNDSD